MLALVVTSGLYAFTYTTTMATMDVIVAGEAIVTSAPSATQPGWDSILTPDAEYSGGATATIYLTNTGDLVKAYDYLNMKVYVYGSVEAEETPSYQLLTLQNGEVNFTLTDIAPTLGTWTQTSQSDFQGGTLNQVNAITNPGNVILDTFSDVVTDTFDDETKIASKTNLV